MRPLLVIGATGRHCPPDAATAIREAIRPALLRAAAAEDIPGRITVFWEDNSVGALDILATVPHAVVAYAPGVFAPAVTRQPVRVTTEGPQLILTTHGKPEDWYGTDDPRQFLEGARSVLRAPVVNVQKAAAMRFIAATLIKNGVHA
jgi:hypothetical protein